jgi:hypothetical protein
MELYLKQRIGFPMGRRKSYLEIGQIPSLNHNIRVIYVEMYIAQVSLLSFRVELSPELPKGFVVFRHATFA